jgi:hypothetical protein
MVYRLIFCLSPVGLIALALQVAREFAFWTEAVYADLKNT